MLHNYNSNGFSQCKDKDVWQFDKLDQCDSMTLTTNQVD